MSNFTTLSLQLGAARLGQMSQPRRRAEPPNGGNCPVLLHFHMEGAGPKVMVLLAASNSCNCTSQSGGHLCFFPNHVFLTKSEAKIPPDLCT
jgi:hypothetical protein